MTITEALAEIKTIKKRMAKKQVFVHDHLFLQGHLKDPLEKEGGSPKAVAEARQAIHDLETRIVLLRTGIASANQDTIVEIEGKTLTIAAWLIWKRDVAPGREAFLEQMRHEVSSLRKQTKKTGITVVDAPATDNTEVSIYISEKDLADQIERHEKIMGELDGKLSLVNATVQLEVN